MPAKKKSPFPFTKGQKGINPFAKKPVPSAAPTKKGVDALTPGDTVDLAKLPPSKKKIVKKIIKKK